MQSASPAPLAPPPVAAPPPAAASRSGLLTPEGRIILTPEEQQLIIFQEGDYYTCRSGIMSISKTVHGKIPAYHEMVYEVNYFFQDVNGSVLEHWGYFLAPPSEGPTLLIQYCRDGGWGTFGMVNLGTGAWTHIVPLSSNPLIKDSARFREVNKMAKGTMLKSWLSPEGAAALAMAALPLGMGQKKAAEIFRSNKDLNSYQGYVEAMEKAVRGLLFRISRDSQSFWSGGNPGSGRL